MDFQTEFYAFHVQSYGCNLIHWKLMEENYFTCSQSYNESIWHGQKYASYNLLRARKIPGIRNSSSFFFFQEIIYKMILFQESVSQAKTNILLKVCPEAFRVK